ncbi:MAG: DUF2269 family protein [Mycobacteriales bacterium]
MDDGVRNILLVLHIFAAILILGALIFMDMIVPGLVRGGRENLPALRKLESLGRVFGPSSGIVFLLGVALVLRNKVYDFSDVWISAAMGLFVVAAVIGSVPMGRTMSTAITKIDEGHPADGEASRLGMLGAINILIMLTIVYLMVAKPGM